MVSHQLEQNKIDGDKTILYSLTEAQSKEHDTFKQTKKQIKTESGRS